MGEFTSEEFIHSRYHLYTTSIYVKITEITVKITEIMVHMILLGPIGQINTWAIQLMLSCQVTCDAQRIAPSLHNWTALSKVLCPLMAMVLYPPKAQKGEARSGRRMESWLLVADLDYFQARPVWQSQSGSLAPWGHVFFCGGDLADVVV